MRRANMRCGQPGGPSWLPSAGLPAAVAELGSLAAMIIRLRMLLSVPLLLLSAGCTYALQAYNRPGPEKLQIITTRTGQHVIRIENHGDTPVGGDGRVVLDVPTLPRGCSPYLFGLIKLGDGSPERLSAIHVLHDGKVVRKLSLTAIHALPIDDDGYRIVTL